MSDDPFDFFSVEPSQDESASRRAATKLEFVEQERPKERDAAQEWGDLSFQPLGEEPQPASPAAYAGNGLHNGDGNADTSQTPPAYAPPPEHDSFGSSFSVGMYDDDVEDFKPVSLVDLMRPAPAEPGEFAPAAPGPPPPPSPPVAAPEPVQELPPPPVAVEPVPAAPVEPAPVAQADPVPAVAFAPPPAEPPPPPAPQLPPPPLTTPLNLTLVARIEPVRPWAATGEAALPDITETIAPIFIGEAPEEQKRGRRGRKGRKGEAVAAAPAAAQPEEPAAVPLDVDAFGPALAAAAEQAVAHRVDLEPLLAGLAAAADCAIAHHVDIDPLLDALVAAAGYAIAHRVEDLSGLANGLAAAAAAAEAQAAAPVSEPLGEIFNSPAPFFPPPPPPPAAEPALPAPPPPPPLEPAQLTGAQVTIRATSVEAVPEPVSLERPVKVKKKKQLDPDQIQKRRRMIVGGLGAVAVAVAGLLGYGLITHQNLGPIALHGAPSTPKPAPINPAAQSAAPTPPPVSLPPTLNADATPPPTPVPATPPPSGTGPAPTSSGSAAPKPTAAPSVVKPGNFSETCGSTCTVHVGGSGWKGTITISGPAHFSVNGAAASGSWSGPASSGENFFVRLANGTASASLSISFS